ncbi:MAG: DNA-processing protein DprA [Chloroflexota bacterium]|nr:DNA-processing protein DprA [Chloroflexota bacterium]
MSNFNGDVEASLGDADSGRDTMTQRPYWVGFHLVPYIGPHRIGRLISHFGGLDRAWRASPRDLSAILDERSIESLVKTRSSLDLDAEMERLERSRVEVITIPESRYPRLLAQIPAPPPVLYVRGTLLPEDDVAVAIVGTRRFTSYGREVTSRIAAELAEFGVTIVSGLARGIDGFAHQSALRAGGRTLAVLGSGVNVIYPPEHRKLAEEIVERGALVSDYPPDRKPDAPNFPARNRLISGLSLGVIVTEAPGRSGALITTDFAADQGREVFIVPGSVLSGASEGCNRLLRDGARPVTSAADVLEDLRLGERRADIPKQQSLALDDDERRILALLTADPQHIDEVAAGANLPIAKAAALLLTMELNNLVRNSGAQHYTRL